MQKEDIQHGKEKMKMNKEEKLAKAIAFAAEKHANQKRKDGTPYIFHPLEVAELLKRYGYIFAAKAPMLASGMKAAFLYDT